MLLERVDTARTHEGRLLTYCWPRLSDMRRNEHQEVESEDIISPHISRRNGLSIWLYNFVRCFAITTRSITRSQRHIIAGISDHICTCLRRHGSCYTTPLSGPSIPSRRLCTIARPSLSPESHNHRTLTITRPSQSHSRYHGMLPIKH